MTVRILHSSALGGKINFAYSPHVEMLCSLHVLCNAKHHGVHLQWAARTKRRFDRRMIADLRYFGRAFNEYMALVDPYLPDPTMDLKTFDDEKDDVAALPDEEFAFRVLRSHFTREEIHTCFSDERERRCLLAGIADRETRQGFDDLLADPAGFRKRLSGFLSRYWEGYFATEFQRLEPQFLADLTRKAWMLRRMEAGAFLTSLSNRIVADVESDQVTIRKECEFTIDCGRLQWFTVIPSVFISPHLMLGEGADSRHFVVAYDLLASGLQESVPLPPGRLVSILRALGDEVRLTILRLVGEQRRSTQELSQLLSLTPPSVSRHLRILKEAGLVSSVGEGYYVYYHLVPSDLAALGNHLSSFLGCDLSIAASPDVGHLAASDGRTGQAAMDQIS